MMGRKPLSAIDRVDIAFDWAGRVRRAREQRGLTQTQLGMLTNRTPAQISYLESGTTRPEPEAQAAIAAALEYAVAALFPRDQDEALEAQVD